MKKILFTILAAAAVSAACTKFEQDTVPTYDSVAMPEVTATVVSDTEITVTVTAAENTHYYGYAVMKGAPGATADKLVAGGYAKDGNVVAQGEDNAPQAAQVKYSEETKTVTLELTGLTPYTEYTVYAAAVTEMGVTSEVAAMTVRTTDGTEPTMTGFDFAESDNVLTFAISFNDPVQLTGNGTAKAWFYAENYYDESGMMILWKEVDIPADHIAASGKDLLVAVPASEYIPGAYVGVTFSGGIVKNGADATNAAYESHAIGYADDGSVSKQGIFGYYDYASWDLSLVDPATLPDTEEGEGNMEDEEGEEEEEEEEIEPIYFSDWTKLYMTAYSTSEYPLAGKTGNGGAGVVTTESNGRSVSYAAKQYGAMSETVIAVMLNEAPAYGSFVSFSIEEGTFCDIFGNENNAFEAEGAYYHSCGYTVEDIVGAYTMTGSSLFVEGLKLSYPMVVAASDNPEKGNIMFTTYFGIEGKLYANFNVHSGEILVKERAIFADGYATYFYGEGDQVFNFEPGMITNDQSYVMVATVEGGSLTGYAADAEGNMLGLYNVVATLN